MDFRKILQKLRLSSAPSNNQTQTQQQNTPTNNKMATKAITFYSHRMWLISVEYLTSSCFVESTNAM